MRSDEADRVLARRYSSWTRLITLMGSVNTTREESSSEGVSSRPACRSVSSLTPEGESEAFRE